ncbi:helix-turn-helix domain-containing protein [Glutamicibacter ectropisis]|uniref:Helix-turn-helix domain-containing protein n=1 Tax=Glutamicibacter ectropisis TaxID=3046593 RepID=A0AAU6WFK6_9MICC
MGRHSDKAREVLLNAAEELFARHGIDAVSNRKITEHAGTANHSAIKYHFGAKDDLLRAMVQRAVDDVRVCREKLVGDDSADPTSLRELVTVHTLALIHSFDALPRPSWRAQFLFQVRLRPEFTEMLAGLISEGIQRRAAASDTLEELKGIPEVVVSSRARILGPMVLGLCAEYEALVNEGEQRGSWESMGYFVVDAVVGMLAAPSTAPADFMDFTQK